MAKQREIPPVRHEAGTVQSNRKVKTKTVQIAEDVAFWAARLAELEETTVSAILDPIRVMLRERLKRDHDTDPDLEWLKLLKSRTRRDGAN